MKNKVIFNCQGNNKWMWINERKIKVNEKRKENRSQVSYINENIK